MAPFPRENKFDYFLMLPTAPCGGGVGSWQLWQMPQRAALPKNQSAQTCFLGKPGCPFCGMGLESWDLFRSKLAALPKSGCKAPCTPSPQPIFSLEASHLFTMRIPTFFSAMELLPLCLGVGGWASRGWPHYLPGSRQPREPSSGAIQPEQQGRQREPGPTGHIPVSLGLGKQKGSTLTSQ